MSNTLNYKRMQSRLLALQALYASQYSQKPFRICLDEVSRSSFMAEEYDDWKNIADHHFTSTLLEGCQQRNHVIDAMLGEYLKDSGKTIFSLDKVLYMIFFLAVEELISDLAENPKITISAWLDVTHSYFDENAAYFVNAILDRIAKNL